MNIATALSCNMTSSENKVAQMQQFWQYIGDLLLVFPIELGPSMGPAELEQKQKLFWAWALDQWNGIRQATHWISKVGFFKLPNSSYISFATRLEMT